MALAFRNIRKRARGFESLTGRRLSPAVVEGFAREELLVQAGRAVQNRQLDIQANRLAFEKATMLENQRIAREAAEAEERAATFAGIGELAVLGKTGVDIASKLGIIGKAEKTKTAVETAEIATGGERGAETAVGAATVTTAEGATFVAEGGATAQVAEGGQGVFGLEAGGGTEAAAPTVLGTAGQVVGAAGAGAVAGFVGQKLTKAGEPGHKGGEVWTGRAIGAIGGAALAYWMVGAQLGTAFGPIGTVVGAVIGAVVGFITGGGGTHICTELYNQGYLTKEMLKLEYEFQKKYIGLLTYAGYTSFALPIVGLMKKSKIFTWVVAQITVPWAQHMCHLVAPKEYRPHRFGKFVMKYGIKFCSWKGKRMYMRSLREVAHG